MLSHGAIVAREFGIPAVLGVGPVIERLSSCAELNVELDGSQGVVFVDIPPEAEQ